MFGEFAVEGPDDVDGDLVNTVVVVAVFREVAFGLEFNGETRFVANRAYFGILDGG